MEMGSFMIGRRRETDEDGDSEGEFKGGKS